jgi:hypothetical protein
VHFFFVAPTTYVHYSGVMRQYLLRTVSIPCTDIPHAFSSYACIVSSSTYSITPKYLRTLLNTLSRQNLYSYLCTYQPNSYALSNTFTPHVHLTMSVLTAQGLIRHVHLHIIIFRVVQQFTEHTCTPTFSRAAPKFTMRASTPTFSKDTP